MPEKIENIYIRSQYVQQVFVHGESLKSCIIAIVVPDVDVVKCWAVENGIPGTLSVLCANPEVKRLILDDMLAWGKEAGLKSFEQVSHRASVRQLPLYRCTKRCYPNEYILRISSIKNFFVSSFFIFPVVFILFGSV